MKTIFGLTLKAAIKNPFLLLWSLFIPIVGSIALGNYIKTSFYPQTILTGMIAMSIMFYAFMTTTYVVLAQRRRGIFNLLGVTPMPLWRYISSTSSAWMLVSLVSGCIVLLCGSIALNIELHLITFLALMLGMSITSIGYIFLSYFIASLCRTENSVSILTNMLTMPLMFLSNAFYSTTNGPAFIRFFQKINPFQWFVNVLRASYDFTWSNYFYNLSLICVSVLLALVLATRTFRVRDY